VKDQLEALVLQMYRSNILYSEGVREFKKRFILTVLQENRGNQCRAARELGMHRNTLSRTITELKIDVRQLRDGVKRPLEIEEAPIRKMGKKLVAARELEEGHTLAAEDVAIKSPADGGLPPYKLESIVGRRLTRRLAPDESVELDDLEPAEEPVAVHAAPRP